MIEVLELFLVDADDEGCQPEMSAPILVFVPEQPALCQADELFGNDPPSADPSRRGDLFDRFIRAGHLRCQGGVFG